MKLGSNVICVAGNCKSKNFLMDTITCNDETLAVSQKQASIAQVGVSIDESKADGDNHLCFGRELFTERDMVLKTVAQIVQLLQSDNTTTQDMTRARQLAKNVADILDAYQEDSVLLDPHVPDITGPLIQVVSDHVKGKSQVDHSRLRLICSILYVVSKVCGYRSMSGSNVFPHHVSFLEPLIKATESLFNLDSQWEIKFVLLLWLSVLLLLPFNFSVVLKSGGGYERLRFLAIQALRSPTLSVSKAGALVMGRLLSRDASLIGLFIEAEKSENLLGCLEALNQTLKMLPSKLTDDSTIEKITDLICAVPINQDPGTQTRMNILRARIAARICRSERTVAILSNALSNRDQVVRWAAAKGCGRLGVVPEISNGHGKCLALAELIVRGSQAALAETISSAQAAMRSPGEGGATASQMRDAACYAVWAVSRTLKQDELNSIVIPALLPDLVLTCLFDREINCRRVGASALQELVGRCGTVRFACGLELIQILDFWTVANRDACYLEHSLKVVELLPHLADACISHLTEKLGHVDPDIRRLAARALALLIKTDYPNYFEKLTAVAFSVDAAVNTREGVLRFLADAVLIWPNFSDDLQAQLRNIVPRLEKERLYRGRGGEMVRLAACTFLTVVSAQKEKIIFKPATAERYWQTIYEGLRHLTQSVQAAAASSLLALTTHREVGKEVVLKLLEILADTGDNISARRGCVLGLAYLSPAYLSRHEMVETVFLSLKTEALAWPKHPSRVADCVDAETRRFALLGVLRIASITNFQAQAEEICLLACEDFAVDRRGDVGSWVRETAVDGLCMLNTTTARGVAALLGRCGERLDRMRGHAARRLHGLVHGRGVSIEEAQAALWARDGGEKWPSPNQHISSDYSERVKSAFFDPPKDSPELSAVRSAWATSACVFDRVCSLLDIPDFRLEILRSLVSCIGGVTAESVTAASRAALIKHCPNSLDFLLDLLLVSGEPRRVSNRQERNNRFISPVFESLAFVISVTGRPTDVSILIKKVEAEICGSRDTHKLRAAVSLLVSLLPDSAALRVAVHCLLDCGIAPIRHAAATAMYTVLVEVDEMEAAVDLLASTEWTEDGSGSAVDGLCDLFGFARPVRSVTVENVPAAAPKHVVPDYVDLVKEAHW